MSKRDLTKLDFQPFEPLGRIIREAFRDGILNDVSIDGTLDLTGITDGNIPYISASGFADSSISEKSTTIEVDNELAVVKKAYNPSNAPLSNHPFLGSFATLEWVNKRDTSDVLNGVLTHIDSDDQGDSAYNVWGDGKFIYLANRDGGLHVYSVSDAGVLTHIDSDNQGDLSIDVWGDGKFIYLANYGGGLHVYSVSDAGVLTHIDSDDQGDGAYGVWGDGKFIYLANRDGGLHVYSVSDAGVLTHIDSDDQGDEAYGVWGDGKFIYLANYGGGLHVYSVSDAGVLTHIDSDDQGDGAYGVWGDGKFIYLANRDGGLHVYSVDKAYEYDKGNKVHAFVGGVEHGADGISQGTLTLWDGSGGNTPGYVRIGSPNGTVWYLFVEDDGTVKVHNAAPTANADGSAIGDQTD